ncbi:glutamate--cysteine ligase catalytic subunit-like [Hyalella azteca]|uniref:Glutamate--cysteine ligase n=1 Tax=Hyalella azteca TaxID=294128 RepID=A0A8B7NY62_HYAAZ|nr:glutamate--cysteine ligase catalytic subunit-like [Hyalella azteca]
MGLLSEGTPLSWPETKKLAPHVRKHGVQQFLNHYQTLKDRTVHCLKWGDEIEYTVVKFDHANRKARVSLRGSSLLTKLQEAEEKNPKEVRSLWRPEYAEYMVEGTPGQPYGWLVQHFNIVEHNMAYRRQELHSLLEKDEVALSITCFPRLGCLDFTLPTSKATPTSGPSRSLFFPSAAITQCHPRFSTLTTNIRQRRGRKVAINVPIFKDLKTPSPFIEDFTPYGDDADKSHSEGAKPDHVYMDAMGFGMGCSCLQMTFQARTESEARVLYDHLTPICPILLALTAATPIFRGYLTAIDCRWDVISASVDCRTREESGEVPLSTDRFVIPKSRYSSVSCYLSACGTKYNDLPLVQDPDVYSELIEAGVDAPLAQHIAHLFIRDSISLFSEKVDQDDTKEMDHFENIQSTNWQSMRFKIPPPNSDIGWRVEFRPCEVQITDFENAAYGVFIVLLTRAILTFKLNMLVPLSKVDENMEKSQRQDAVLTERFWFRQNILSRDCDQGDDSTLMTIDEIINGKEGTFVGLVGLVRKYLNSLDLDTDTACTVGQYLNLIRDRASGKANTAAAWIRNFVRSHPEYKHDSVVSDSVSYDLLVACHEISCGKRQCVELLGGTPKSRTQQDIPHALHKILSKSKCQ